VTTQKRQGDIFFQTVQEAPNGPPMSSNIIAHGEVTGHSHKVDIPISDCESVVDAEGNIWIRSEQPIPVTHDEHTTITLEPGQWWNITRQREYDPIEEIERRVRD
jgi:hypothetical protein